MAAIASQSNQLYSIRPYGKAFLIKCSDASKCDFYGEPIHTPSDKLTLFYHPQTDGWIVRGSEGEEAAYWVEQENDYVEAARILATMGEEEAPECEVELGEDEDNFTLERYGRGYLIECSDPSECPWWGEKYISLSNTEGAGTAFWNNSLEGYVVRRRDVNEAEYFVHLANHPKAPRASTPTPTTPPRLTRPIEPAAPRRTRKTRTFPTDATDGGEVRFTRATARCLFQADQEKEEAGEVVWGGEAEARTEAELVEEDSDSDYVPSDDEESEDDDELFAESITEGPYTGMTLRSRGRGGYRRPAYYLTCAASHRLHGRPFLGHPAARGVRANCWEVNGEAAQQFLDGGAKMEE